MSERNVDPEEISEAVYTSAITISRWFPWYDKLTTEKEIHPAIYLALKEADANSWHDLMMQWPSIADMDKGRIAYTQSIAKGERDLRTVTSVGKYLRANFADLKDHQIRRISEMSQGGAFEVRKTLDGIVAGIQEGPSSCMKWSEDRLSKHDNHHPYECYDPKFGWGHAVVIDENSAIIGRALVYEDSEHKCYVRTYDARSNGAVSEALTARLTANGYEKRGSWPEGIKLAKAPGGCGGYVFPYIDGNSDRLSDGGDCWIIDDSGKIKCDNTDGTVDYFDGDGTECEHCGDLYDEYNIEEIEVTRNRMVCVCSSCRSDNYTWRYELNIYTRDSETFEEQGLVELANGNPAYEGDAFLCPVNEEWYHVREGTDTVDNGMVHDDEVWHCYATGDAYSTLTDSVQHDDGETYHPDNVPVSEDDEETAEVVVPQAVVPEAVVPEVLPALHYHGTLNLKVPGQVIDNDVQVEVTTSRVLIPTDGIWDDYCLPVPTPVCTGYDVHRNTLNGVSIDAVVDAYLTFETSAIGAARAMSNFAYVYNDQLQAMYQQPVTFPAIEHEQPQEQHT